MTEFELGLVAVQSGFGDKKLLNFSPEAGKTSERTPIKYEHPEAPDERDPDEEF